MSSSGSSCVGIGLVDIIIPGIDPPHNCADPGNLRQSEWDQKLEKIECVFSLYDKMRWKWDKVYLLWGRPKIYSPSRCPPPVPLYLRTLAVAWSLKIYFEAVIRRVWRCICRLSSSELRDAHGGRDRASLAMHLETEIEWTKRSTWWLGSSEFEDAFGDQDQVNSEMHL